MKTFFLNFRAAQFICVAVLCVGLCSPAAAQFNPNLAAKLQETLDAQVATFTDTKGVSASVYYPGQGIWKGASGLSFAGQPITTGMEFGIASNTKLFTAVAIMKLVENNILKLSDSLHKWLPKYNNVDSTITIRQLLNHTSGIADMFTAASMAYIDANPSHVFTTTEVMAYVGPKLFNPGTNYGYSNTNYFLAGLIAESATGKHISKIIRDSILTPLQLDSTFFDGKETVLGTIAHPWHNGVDGYNTSRAALNSLGVGAGAMYSTASEMAQWYQALLSGQVVSAASLAQITNFLSPGNYGFGMLTMQLFGRTVWGHGGSNTGYKSRMFYDPDMKAVVCGLSNSNPSAIDGAITGVLLKTLVDYLPATAGTITGATSVCQRQDSVRYTVPPITNASTYVWTLPDGASGTSTTNSITVKYGGAAASGSITVRGSNMYGEGATAKLLVTVHPAPEVTCKLNSPGKFCLYAAPVILSGGNPPGGTYSGKGVQGGMFDPKMAGVGECVITYSYTNANGCNNADSAVITVVPRPTVMFAPPATDKFCRNSAAVTLSGGTPIGGVYSGQGVNNGIFDPSAAGAGSFMITYAFTDSNGCSGAASALLMVLPEPKVSYTSPKSNVCLNTPPVALTGGAPAGGIYAGKGVSNGIFDPAAAGEGKCMITYSYTDANGCTNADSGVITVALPTSATLNETAVGSFTLNGKTYTQSGTYTQVLANAKGCDSVITLQLTIVPAGITEQPVAARFNLYPNPSNGTFTVETEAIGDVLSPEALEIYSVLGAKVYSAFLTTTRTEIPTNLQRGVYIWRVYRRGTLIFAGKLAIL